MKLCFPRFLCFVAMISMFACLALLATRGYYAISLVEPLQGQTRGAEYESLFPIWKEIQGLSLYTDLTEIPYTGTYYNWLYYISYASVSELFLSLLSLGDAWIPTVTRITTLVGAITGAALIYLSMIRLFPLQAGWLKVITASLSVSVFLGPLTGYFAIATTPDIWPLAAAVAAISLFIIHYEKSPLSAILAVCLLSYFAWAFKQNFLNIPATIGLFLLVRRDWKNAAILTVVLITAGILTLILGGPEYRSMLLFGETQLSLTFEQLGINLFGFLVKTLPVLTLAGGFVVLSFSAPDFRRAFAEMIHHRPTMMVPFIGVMVSMIEAIPTGAIVAAAENHFFHLAYFVAFSSLILLHLSTMAAQPIIKIGLCAGFIGNTLAIASVFIGVQGSLSVREFHDLLTTQSRCLRGLSQSIYVDDPNLSLPWMVPANDHFVLEYSYEWDRAKGVEFEAGGVGGLIDKGYFEHIAILKSRGRQIDGSDMSLYPNMIRSCGRFNVYERSLPSANQ